MLDSFVLQCDLKLDSFVFSLFFSDINVSFLLPAKPKKKGQWFTFCFWSCYSIRAFTTRMFCNSNRGILGIGRKCRFHVVLVFWQNNTLGPRIFLLFLFLLKIDQLALKKNFTCWKYHFCPNAGTHKVQIPNLWIPYVIHGCLIRKPYTSSVANMCSLDFSLVKGAEITFISSLPSVIFSLIKGRFDLWTQAVCVGVI